MSVNCNHCKASFPSRNKLFIHIRTDHSQSNCEQQQGAVSTSSTFSINEYGAVTVVHEDDWCRIIVKPQGVATMGSDDRSLMKDRVLIMPERFQYGVSYRKAIPCHRLDRATGGIVVCSKSKESETCIRLCFRYKFIQKRYCAIVSGHMEHDEGLINFKVSGKDAFTKYQVIQRSASKQYGTITTVNLWPITGRRHQLRKHLQELGHHILGDTRYSHAAQWPQGIDRLFLWAVEIDLPHPRVVSEVLQRLKVDIDDLSKDIKNFDSENDDEDEVEGAVIVAGEEGTNDHENHQDKKRKVDNTGNHEKSLNVSLVSQLSSNLHGCERLKIAIKEPKYYQEFRDATCK